MADVGELEKESKRKMWTNSIVFNIAFI